MKVISTLLVCLCLTAGLTQMSRPVKAQQEKIIVRDDSVESKTDDASQDIDYRSQIKTAEVNFDFTKTGQDGEARFDATEGVLQRDNGLAALEYERSGHVTSQKIKVPINSPEPYLAVHPSWKAAATEDNGVSVSLRGSGDGRSWGDWQRVNVDHDTSPAPGFYSGSSVYFDKQTKYIQYRILIKPDAQGVSPTVSSLELRFISPGATPPDKLRLMSEQASGSDKSAPEPGAAGALSVAKPHILSRTVWGCPEGQSSPDWIPEKIAVTHLIVHHTDDEPRPPLSDWSVRVREIWTSHRYKKLPDGTFQGDIGYNYLIAPNGLIYEGRAGGEDIKGAHFSNANTGTMGVAVLGNYSTAGPSAAALASLKRLLAWKAGQKGIDPEGSTYHSVSQLTLKNISGHRDANASPVESVSTPGTACPGSEFYKLLGTIRHDVRNMISGVCAVSVPATDWRAAYYNNASLTGTPAMVSNDGTWFLDFEWGKGGPGGACGVGADNFSVRWTRTLNLISGLYRFTVTTDDGVRLYVDGQLKLDKWFDQGPTTYNVDVSLSTGQHDVRLDYYEHGADATAKLFWKRIGNSVLPTVGGFLWNTTPKANEPFGGTITGNGFVPSETDVWFCRAGTGTCYIQPAAGVKVNSASSLTVTNVRLGSGSWQFYVKTQAGASLRSAAFTVQATGLTIGNYSWNTPPKANQPFGGTVTGTGFVTGATQVWFCVNGTNTCYQHPLAGVTVNSASNLTLTNVSLGGGSWQFYVKTTAGQSARSSAFTVQSVGPTIASYSWNTSPTANQLFGGTITGTGFVTGATQVWFCINGTNTCYQQPAAGVKVNSSTSLSVTNVNLGGGSWQVYVQTAAGKSGRSTPFTVQTPAPTITSYSWNTNPVANHPFGGTISGTGFVAGNTQVWFCVDGSSVCYQHPSAGVTVNSSTSLSVTNANLASGPWQIYVKTPAGQSSRSNAFTVQSAGPTITGYSWDSTPTANQSFDGTITGTGFVSGGTQVWFCVNGSLTCYQQPSGGIDVNSSTRLSVYNVNLSSGSWQIYVQTSAGQSSRSSAFTVQVGSPTITSYSWNSTPVGGQPFSGSLSGTGFVSGGTQVWFCINGSSTCYQQPAAGVSVNSSSSLGILNVNLSSGSWQFYVRTSVGQSARSSVFTVW